MKLMDQNQKHRCVLVLGMHRSGTSALTRCLNLLGMDLGSNLLSPEAANSKGFWEHADAVSINDALLQSFGMYWHSLAPLPEGWLQTAAADTARDEIRALIRRDFSGVPLWGIKDPRMCRLAPLWLEVLRDMGISVAAVFVVRSPLDVAASLERAHGLSVSSNVFSWMQHLAESETATRGVARTMVEYNRLLADPLGVLSGIGRALDLEWPIAVDGREQAIRMYLDVDLRTHHKPMSDAAAPLIVRHMVDACEQIVLAKNGNDWSRLSTLSDEAVELTDVLAFLNPPSSLPQAPVVPGPTDAVYAMLYYTSGDEPFSEQRVISKYVSAGRSHIEFNLPYAFSRFRLDPVNRGGCCLLHSVMVLDGAGNVIWDWSKSTDSVELVGFQRIASFARQEEQLLLVNDDPQMLFTFPDALLPNNAVLRLDIERLSESELGKELRCAEARRASDLANSERALQDLAAQLDAVRVVHEQDRAALEREHAAYEQERVAYEQERVIHMRELEAIHASTSWRVLAHIRSLLQHLPPVVRRNLRRTVKLAWWMVTPWRIPARLRLHGRDWQRVRLQARPAHQLEEKSRTVDETVWQATGLDPFFYLAAGTDSSVDLPGGWYLLDIPLKERFGTLNSPKLYPDYGAGISEVFSFSLEQICTSSGINGLIRFDYPVTRLRFDPSVGSCEFALSGISLRRLSKFRAALYMYRALVRRERRPIQLALQVFGQLCRGGMRQVGDWLYGRFAMRGKAGAVDYSEWVKRYDTIDLEDCKAMQQASESLALQPLISILIPVYNTPESWIRRCIDSVLRQSYPYWELCIADDASNLPHIRQILEQYEARDSRVKVVYRDSNGHISEASNSALALATGEWIALLDHDDELPPHALFMVAKTINERPNAQLIYSDEDKIDEQGKRFDPYFKPDWNPDLFLSQNMITHLGVYHANLVHDVGGFRKGYEGSQDYDLALRCIERLGDEQIIHIPYVLYHWRAISGSTAMGVGEKSYAALAAERALKDHLARTGVSMVEVHTLDSGYRVKRRLASGAQPKVSLIVPTRDRVDLLRMCVSSILEKTEYDNYEIIVVDNQSVELETHDYLNSLRNHRKVRVLEYDAPFNYSKMNNLAAASCDSEIIGLINNDIEVIHGEWLAEMVSQAVRPEIGAVGAMLYYPNDTIQHAGVVLGVGGVAGHIHIKMPKGYPGQMSRAKLIQNLSAVTAACLLIRHEVFDAVGGLDPQLEVAFNDVDFCLRVREKGFRNLWTPFAELYHHESASRGQEDTPEKKERFMREVVFMTERWGDQLLRDPAYNPNLTVDDTSFSLAVRPRVAPLMDIVSGQASFLNY
jgi:glycosyltransferase involved in cell wall biosynthesis